ncbi:hypothetical protein [Chengkuizengella axinellae]|uniref:Uncharacterized protein n=1 Tax=Chengkuizengella axinellae TaxID=3064388 RepID=A0ABT9J3S4_9BACL|nr:hypothetical protein [Chengkuizengella sp. 2205SS18-9]MDP5276249.1 hypothetical protein [Chengkuizengella sp. 2205SS18-9]
MNEVKVPNGNEKIKIELTMKEAIALTGIRFNQQPELLIEAKKKLMHTIEENKKMNIH